MYTNGTELDLLISLVVSAILFIAICLCSINSYIMAYWSWRQKLRIDAKLDARIAKYGTYPTEPGTKRALSSTCVERLTLNQKVLGSNPRGLTITGSEESDVKRRIWWHLNERTAVSMSDGDILPIKFQWRDLPHFWEEIPGKPLSRRIRDFKPDEHKVQLLWDGVQADTFLDEVVLKQFIIRMVYMIGNTELVPSELLADANLVYKDDWVDKWGCQDKNDEIIECPREIFRPKDRNIRIMRGNDLRNRHGGHGWFVAPGTKPHISAKLDRREIPARIEVPDEKCFFSFRAGGFYEKDQKPLKETCEKEKKTV